jgi:hypothetical protein
LNNSIYHSTMTLYDYHRISPVKKMEGRTSGIINPVRFDKRVSKIAGCQTAKAVLQKFRLVRNNHC